VQQTRDPELNGGNHYIAHVNNLKMLSICMNGKLGPTAVMRAQSLC
jgi:hypothetical protein